MDIPTQAEIEETLRGEDLDTWRGAGSRQASRAEAHHRSDSISD